MEMGISTAIAAFLTLCIFSFLYKDNPFYTMAEHIVVGVSAGYFTVLLFRTTVKDNLWLRVSRMIDDPCFGLRAGELWHPSHLNALGYAWLASATLREALHRLERYLHFISKIADFQLQESKHGIFFLLING